VGLPRYQVFQEFLDQGYLHLARAPRMEAKLTARSTDDSQDGAKTLCQLIHQETLAAAIASVVTHSTRILNQGVVYRSRFDGRITVQNSTKSQIQVEGVSAHAQSNPVDDESLEETVVGRVSITRLRCRLIQAGFPFATDENLQELLFRLGDFGAMSL